MRPASLIRAAMNSIDQQQSSALSFNGRMSRFEREDAGSNPAGAANIFRLLRKLT